MEELIQFRHELHKYPEISGEEKETSQRVLQFLSKYPPNELLTDIGGTGILAIYKGKKQGKTILFRCELDALPITETNPFAHKSIYDSISHKCGHDGHMSILCGLAKKISEKPIENGTVLLLFQPSEENGKGAKKVLQDKKFKPFQPDFVFALHNLPGFQLHKIIVKENTFTCAVNSIIIKLYGKTAHAGEPENGINPAASIAEIIQAFTAKINPDIDSTNYCLLTPIYIHMGEKAYGVSAGYGEVHFTARSNSNAQMKTIEMDLEQTATQIAKKII